MRRIKILSKIIKLGNKIDKSKDQFTKQFDNLNSELSELVKTIKSDEMLCNHPNCYNIGSRIHPDNEDLFLCSNHYKTYTHK